jgi:uncharacterized membrane protein
MESKAKALGHPIHPIMIVFPVGLLVTAAIFDGIYLLTDDAQFAAVAFWMIVSGTVGGLLAAIPGMIDWLAIPRGTRAARVGMWHAVGNFLALGLYAGSAITRWLSEAYVPEAAALALSFVGLAIIMVTGWLGGELVHRLRISIDEGAHADAPNSLSGQPIEVRATDVEELEERAVGDRNVLR